MVDGEDGNTCRTAVAAEFEEGLRVLDVFNKKSSKRISTPKKDIDRIAARLTRLREFRKTDAGMSMIREMISESETAKLKLASRTLAELRGHRR